MRLILAFAAVLAASQAQAAASCAPTSTSSRIFASADAEDIHPDWSEGSRIGLSWSLEPTGDEQGADGSYFIIGNLIDPRGNVVNEGVYVSDMEWECDSDE